MSQGELAVPEAAPSRQSASDDSTQPGDSIEASDPADAPSPSPANRASPGARGRPILPPGANRAIDWVAAAVHFLHGSRGLLVAIPLLLALSLIEPLLPPEIRTTALTLPLMILVTSAILTLPREAAASQHAVRDLSAETLGTMRVVRRLAWPAGLLVLLLPRIFLGAVGIPHMNPLTGLVLPSILQTVATSFLFLLLLVPVLYLRGLRHYNPIVHAPRRPRDLPAGDPQHRTRDALLLLSLLGGAFWAWLLHPFWQPFSLLSWPPALWSLESIRGVASLTYTLVLPLILLQTMAIHLDLLRDLRASGALGQHPALVAAATGHVLLALGAVALHAYDLLWVVRYQAASGL